MSEPAETHAEKSQRILGELTELGLTLARDLHARALAAETAQEAQALGLAFQRVSRSVRQCLALEARMEREAKADAREAVDRTRLDRDVRIRDVKRRVGEAMDRLIWTEADGDCDGIEMLDEDLALRLDEMALAEDFLKIPLETLVERLAVDMGLTVRVQPPAAEPWAGGRPRSDPLAPADSS